jgi:RNA polymerase sigma factor (sigma-70 family)
MPVDSAAAQPVTPDSLIEQCLSGDQAAWEAIVRQNWRKVFNVAYKFVGKHDEAEDLTQDIFLKIFKALRTFDRRANFQTWIISISRNLCIDHYRSVRKERQTIAREVDRRHLARSAGALVSGNCRPARPAGRHREVPHQPRSHRAGPAAQAAAGQTAGPSPQARCPRARPNPTPRSV